LALRSNAETGARPTELAEAKMAGIPAPSRLPAALLKLFGKLRDRFHRNTRRELLYIHIGKCGGATLWSALSDSALIRQQFSLVKRVHIRRPPIRRHTRYLVVVRNPIARALSAFNWRYALVVEDGAQRGRFPREHAILSHYGTLNTLAEALYVDGVLSQEAAGHFNAIHHLGESISFYLRDLLDSISADQLHGVLCTETLDADMARLLNAANPARIHVHAPRLAPERLHLSACAMANLRTFLAEDFSLLARLCTLGNLPAENRALLLA
jgi:hypothetical protein